MKKLPGALIVFALIVAVGIYVFESGHPAVPDSTAAGVLNSRSTIVVNGTTLRVELATTTVAREQGLSGRASLAADEGMLFVFPTDGVYRFWMKEMNFPLDIIWISFSGEVVYIEPSLAPSTYPDSYGATTPARYVLEVNAGFAVSHALHIGDRVTL
jgi:uncharacterized membrane protein (UPF0127 family)